jgi:DNA-binding GntR family transcriptional regulator
MEIKSNTKLKGDKKPRIQLVHETTLGAPEKSNLAQDIYERIKEDIFDFRMPPGQRYSEQSLATTLGVSRTPLRLALHSLAHQGYLNHLEGHSSWQVKPLDLAYYEDIYDFRVDIETLAVRRICALVPMPDLSTLRQFWCVEKAQRVLDGKIVAHEDERFHRALIELAGNHEMLRTFNELTERIRIIRRLDFTNSERIDCTFDEHSKILSVLQARKTEQAEMLMKAHISASRTEIRHITLHMLSLVAPHDEKAVSR